MIQRLRRFGLARLDLRRGAVVFRHALLEGFDALGNIAHQLRDLATPKQQEHDADHQDPMPETHRTHGVNPPHRRAVVRGLASLFNRETRPRALQKQGPESISGRGLGARWSQSPYPSSVPSTRGAKPRSRSPGSSGSSSGRNAVSSEGSGTLKSAGNVPSNRPEPLRSSSPGRSPSASRPKWPRKSGVVPYVSGRPGALRRPRGRTQPVSSSTSRVPLAA